MLLELSCGMLPGGGDADRIPIVSRRSRQGDWPARTAKAPRVIVFAEALYRRWLSREALVMAFTRSRVRFPSAPRLGPKSQSAALAVLSNQHRLLGEDTRHRAVRRRRGDR